MVLSIMVPYDFVLGSGGMPPTTIRMSGVSLCCLACSVYIALPFHCYHHNLEIYHQGNNILIVKKSTFLDFFTLGSTVLKK